MIEWSLFGSGALSIAGLAIVLAAVSYLHWLACGTGQRLSDLLRGRAGAIPCSVGLYCSAQALRLAGRPSGGSARPGVWSGSSSFGSWRVTCGFADFDRTPQRHQKRCRGKLRVAARVG